MALFTDGAIFFRQIFGGRMMSGNKDEEQQNGARRGAVRSGACAGAEEATGELTKRLQKNHVKIFDTTLRDGQQCPGAGMSFEKNLEYARLACDLNIDVLEAGFPAASSLDFTIVNTIAKEFSRRSNAPIVAGLCQLREEQVIKTIDALSPAAKNKMARVHIYVPVDPVLMPASLGDRANDHQGIIADVYRLAKMAVDAGMEVEFSPEGYSRAAENFDFVTELIRAAVRAGGTVINCPDTIGGAATFQGPDYFVENMKRHAAIIKAEFPHTDVTWSVHCHNDFGLAVQNTVNAVFYGPARQVEGCMNGIGERAGNAALEQCIMVIEHFGETVNREAGQQFYTTINTEYLQKASDFVGTNMLPRQPHWPVCGDNAAKHSSGGHTNAVLKNPLAYQPFDPREIGKEISFLFGPMSGGNHAKSIIEAFGYSCQDNEKAQIAQFIKDSYSDRRKGITDKELLEAYFQYRSPVAVESIDYSKSAMKSEIHLRGKFFNEVGEMHAAHEGRDSALAALKAAIENKFGKFDILSHRSHSDTTGINANSVSEILIAVEGDRHYEGTGTDQDIEISAMRALVDAVNKAYVDLRYRREENVSSSVTSRKPKPDGILV
jgi:2-isopropylmalate synthase